MTLKTFKKFGFAGALVQIWQDALPDSKVHWV